MSIILKTYLYIISNCIRYYKTLTIHSTTNIYIIVSDTINIDIDPTHKQICEFNIRYIL